MKELPVLATCDYTVMRVEGCKVVEPNLPQDSEVDGTVIRGLAYRSTLYIRPHQDLNKVRKTIFRISSDDEEDFDEPDSLTNTDDNYAGDTND